MKIFSRKMILLNLLQFVEYTYIFKIQDLPPKMSNFSLKKWGGGVECSNLPSIHVNKPPQRTTQKFLIGWPVCFPLYIANLCNFEILPHDAIKLVYNVNEEVRLQILSLLCTTPSITNQIINFLFSVSFPIYGLLCNQYKSWAKRGK